MSQPISIELRLGSEPTFEEVAVFAYQVATLLPVIPTQEFAKLLGTITESLAHIGATWDEVFTYLKAGAA